MRAVADNLRMLRDFDDSGDVTGWVPVTHRIWDYDHLGCVLYIDRGVSVTADVSEGTGELDAVVVRQEDRVVRRHERCFDELRFKGYCCILILMRILNC